MTNKEDRHARQLADRYRHKLLYLLAESQRVTADVQRSLAQIAIWVALSEDRFDGAAVADIVGRCVDDEGPWGLQEAVGDFKKTVPKLIRSLRRHANSPWLYANEPSYSRFTRESKRKDTERRKANSAAARKKA